MRVSPMMRRARSRSPERGERKAKASRHTCLACGMYPCEYLDDKEMRWCCHRCWRKEGREHNKYCVSQGGSGCNYSERWDRYDDEHGGRSRNSAAGNGADQQTGRGRQGDLHTGDGEALRSERRVAISFGRCGRRGKHVIASNPALGNAANCIDAENLLRKARWEEGGGPDGRDPDTQERMRTHPNWKECLRQIQATILVKPITFVKCKWGKHRSVASLEAAIEDMQQWQSTEDLEIVRVHMECDDVDPALLGHLCRLAVGSERLEDDCWEYLLKRRWK